MGNNLIGANRARPKATETKIGYRVAYSEALARGMTALEWNDRQAQTEMLPLGAELNQILKTQL